MSTIKALFKEAIHYEECVLAHYIFCLVQEGRITWRDERSILTKVQPNQDRLADMIRNNFLGICQIHMYALKVKKGKWYFIYAKSPEEAKRHLWITTGSKSLNCHEVPADQRVSIDNRCLTFREWKKEQSEFPCLVGCFEKINYL